MNETEQLCKYLQNDQIYSFYSTIQYLKIDLKLDLKDERVNYLIMETP
jgi:hypothetical protein